MKNLPFPKTPKNEDKVWLQIAAHTHKQKAANTRVQYIQTHNLLMAGWFCRLLLKTVIEWTLSVFDNAVEIAININESIFIVNG